MGFGDIYPQASLKWNSGVHNFMTYVTGDIPVGEYDPKQLSNIGIGHGAIDGGLGYTYFDPTKGHEFSAVAGFTYNFRNPDTDYRNGVDFHLDWAASQWLSKQLFVGVVGYAYQQLTADSGQPAILGDFKSRVFGIGPQIGLCVSGKRHAGLSRREKLFRIRIRKSPRGLECVGHARLLSGGQTGRRVRPADGEEISRF